MNGGSEDAKRISRRAFVTTAAAVGASLAWAGPRTSRPGVALRERRDLYPEGVASGDPDDHSVLLWTRRPFSHASRAGLRVDVAEDEAFTRIVATATARVMAASDWTCRVLVGNLRPAHVYWYRFIDEAGNSSRVGRTRTAPAVDDPRPVKFAFCSCQNINLGALHAYRRMIFEDERAAEAERLGFVLHLGDFIYEAVAYSEDGPSRRGRPVRDILRYPHGQKADSYPLPGAFYVPTTVDDYRTVYRAYLRDPDLQDARARWPFVCMWDNSEFSWSGWQSLQTVDGDNRPAQTRRVAASQAWFEYQPARIAKSGGRSSDRFDPPPVQIAPIERFDEYGFGDEVNNRAAVASLTGFRALRWGRHLELMVTDQRSYRSEDPTGRPEAQALTTEAFPQLLPQEAAEILDAGRAYQGGRPPATIPFDGEDVPNFRKDDPPQTLLGAEQKKWFLQRLRASRATWKIWGNSQGTLDGRVDPQNLPAALGRPWPGSGYAVVSSFSDYSRAFLERGEIYGVVRDEKVTGFATVSGDRHSFWAGLAAPALPPEPFEPVGVAFVTGSLSSPGLLEAMEHALPHAHPLRALYLLQPTSDAPPEPTVNLLLRHGVQSCLEYQRTGDIERARRLSNPELSPHLSFLDLGGHGYATVRVSGDALECEFVCIPRPIDRVTTPAGGPLLYRVVHRVPLWQPGERPRLEQRVVEGNPVLSL